MQVISQPQNDFLGQVGFGQGFFRPNCLLGRHSPNISTIILQLFYDFSTIIPRTHFPLFRAKS
jgi:hypothetical protein